MLDIAAAPLRFKEVRHQRSMCPRVGDASSRLDSSACLDLPKLELSLVPPKDLKGFELAPVSVAKDQSKGKLIIRAAAEAAP